MNSYRHSGARGSATGNVLALLLFVGLIAIGGWLWLGRKDAAGEPTPGGAAAASVQASDGEAPEPIEPVTGTPTLEAAGTYEPKEGVLEIDISEYAGYGGLIVANGGLEPNPESFFATEYGV